MDKWLQPEQAATVGTLAAWGLGEQGQEVVQGRSKLQKKVVGKSNQCTYKFPFMHLLKYCYVVTIV